MGKEINVGLLGFGTVGSGTARILLEQQKIINARFGGNINLKWICDKDRGSDRGFPVPEGILTDDLDMVLNDPDVDIFIELIGGLEPARTFVLKAIDKGKHIVTANKALLATHGFEIFRAASEKGVEVGFEASVGGGIPCIKAIKEGLAANNIQTVMGIMNGTANYILSRMTEEGEGFEEVLKDAQKLGYAEADPTYDIEGIDTAHKLAIMSTLAFGCKVTLDDIFTEGISGITPVDIAFAGELGYKVKLLAIGRSSEEGIEVRIHPTMIPASHLLAQVSGAYNALYMTGDSVGKVMLYGMGAGQMPTGSAVVADVMDIARDIAAGAVGRQHAFGIPFDSIRPAVIRPVAELSGKYYCRFNAKDRPGVLSAISGILSNHGISIESVVQKKHDFETIVPIVMLTHEAVEKDINSALKEIEALDIISEKPMIIRIEELASI
jgi:homoserine dehydrogenase